MKKKCVYLSFLNVWTARRGWRYLHNLRFNMCDIRRPSWRRSSTSKRLPKRAISQILLKLDTHVPDILFYFIYFLFHSKINWQECSLNKYCFFLCYKILSQSLRCKETFPFFKDASFSFESIHLLKPSEARSQIRHSIAPFPSVNLYILEWALD